ncbi:MAG: DUF2235 domain-containing protein [Pseudomonadota bacterium]
MPLRDRFLRLIGRGLVTEATPTPTTRGYRKLVIILDGTLSQLEPGCETNAGLAMKLLREEAGPEVQVYYEAGLQWSDWGDTWSVMTGTGISAQIQRAYGWLASHYRRGDRIFLIGYSRGAYAARSLAGLIGRIGLVTRHSATERNLRQAFRLYADHPKRQAEAADFAQAHCHPGIQIECVAVWDTVKALGVRLPVFWLISRRMHRFHDHALGDHVRAGFHALALHETRRAYAPVLWESVPGWRGELQQVWFRGVHGDIGGQLGGRMASRPLANIPFVWLMEQVDRAGIGLPHGWQDGVEQDVDAPSIGRWAGWAKLFVYRWPRRMGRDPSESLHASVADREAGKPVSRVA